jgi:hypothetical protein
MYSTGDLPSMRASSGPAATGRRGFDPPAPPRRRRAVGRGQGGEALKKTGSSRLVPQAFQEQVIETKGEIEGGIAIPGAFGIEEDAPPGPTRMFFGLTSPWTSVCFVPAVVATSWSRAGAK